MPKTKNTRKASKADKDANCDLPCPIERGMRLLGGKWTGSILWHLRNGPVRFNDLSRQLSGASKKMLTQRLREMETNGMVKRKVLASKPIAVSYSMTDFGESALKCLKQVKKWAVKQDV